MAFKGVKSPRNKKIISNVFCLAIRIFLVLVLLSALVERCFVSHMRDFRRYAHSKFFTLKLLMHHAPGTGEWRQYRPSFIFT